MRFETPPGKQLQIDFGERRVLIGEASVKVFLFVATLGYSRRLYVHAFRNERQENWFAGLESAFERFGGVTEEVLFDNDRGLVVHHDRATREVEFNARLHAFAKHWGFRPRACAPYRARSIIIRAAVALLFAVPAAIAGYHATLGLAEIGVPSQGWRVAFSIVGAIIVGGMAWARMTLFASPLRADRRLPATSAKPQLAAAVSEN